MACGTGLSRRLSKGAALTRVYWGSQYLSIRDSERLGAAGVEPSIGI